MDTKRWLIICFLLLSFIVSGCSSPTTVKIGIAVELTGTRGELGIALRNGALLAIEEINASGGINGQMLELIIRDDQGDPDLAVQMDQELIDEGVSALIGHVTSGQTAVVLDQINESQIVMVSGSASSTEFSGQDDYFFRIAADTNFLGKALAAHIIEKHDFQKLTLVISQKNDAFVLPFSEAFEAKFTEAGGRIAERLQIDCADLTCTAAEIKAFSSLLKSKEPDCVIAVTSAYDLALLVQYSAQDDFSPHWFSSSWAQTNELIEKGGSAVEGVELIATFHPNYPSEQYQEFAASYSEHYGKPPSLLSSNGYIAIQYLADALRQTNGNGEDLKTVLDTIESIDSIQGTIKFDAFGDASREIYFAVITDGEFQIVETIMP